MISSLKAMVSGPIVTALNCPLNATCRLIQDHHGVMVFDCRHLRRVLPPSGSEETTIECYFPRLALVPGRQTHQHVAAAVGPRR